MSTKVQPEDHRDLLGGRCGCIHSSKQSLRRQGNQNYTQAGSGRPMLTKYRSDTGYLKYTAQCVLIGGPELTLHLLKNL